LQHLEEHILNENKIRDAVSSRKTCNSEHNEDYCKITGWPLLRPNNNI
jgi:hypothetical protein